MYLTQGKALARKILILNCKDARDLVVVVVVDQYKSNGAYSIIIQQLPPKKPYVNQIDKA